MADIDADGGVEEDGSIGKDGSVQDGGKDSGSSDAAGDGSQNDGGTVEDVRMVTPWNGAIVPGGNVVFRTAPSTVEAVVEICEDVGMFNKSRNAKRYPATFSRKFIGKGTLFCARTTKSWYRV